MKTIEDLRTIAMSYHTKPYGKYDYVFHLDGVHAIAVEFGLSEVVKRASYGHDLREDTDISKEKVETDFGAREAVLIEAVSGHGANRAEKQRNIVEKLTMLDEFEANGLKMCDRLFNMRHSLSEENWKTFDMYCSEESLYAPVFAKGPENLQAALNELYALRK